ncbi:hypothetical protein WJX74_005156 [Apatococcus lobatus]|uniref:Uncharacterized protein n=1 Tax=Apatococcus lobatus TaxID=904363 RepID=A0AAW1QYD2_9CHLO
MNIQLQGINLLAAGRFQKQTPQELVVSPFQVDDWLWNDRAHQTGCFGGCFMPGRRKSPSDHTCTLLLASEKTGAESVLPIRLQPYAGQNHQSAAKPPQPIEAKPLHGKNAGKQVHMPTWISSSGMASASQAKGSSLDVRIRAHPRSALRTLRWNPPADVASAVLGKSSNPSGQQRHTADTVHMPSGLIIEPGSTQLPWTWRRLWVADDCSAVLALSSEPEPLSFWLWASNALVGPQEFQWQNLAPTPRHGIQRARESATKGQQGQGHDMSQSAQVSSSVQAQFVTVQDGGASVVIAEAAHAPDASHTVMVKTLIQPMCAPVPSLGRPEPAAWRVHRFELVAPEERGAAPSPGAETSSPPRPSELDDLDLSQSTSQWRSPIAPGQAESSISAIQLAWHPAGERLAVAASDGLRNAWLLFVDAALTCFAKVCWRDVVPGMKPTGPSQRAGGSVLQAIAWLPDAASLAAMDCHGNLAFFNMNGCLQTLKVAPTASAFQAKDPARKSSLSISHGRNAVDISANGTAPSSSTIIPGHAWSGISDAAPKRWMAMASAKPCQSGPWLLVTDGAMLAIIGLPGLAARQDVPQARSIWQLAAQAAQKRKEDRESTETPLSQELPDSLLLHATNLQLCCSLSSLHGLEAGVKECWRLGLSDEAGQLLRHLTESHKNLQLTQNRKKRSHAAMLGLHGLPELALAMPGRLAETDVAEDAAEQSIAEAMPDPAEALLQGNAYLLTEDMAAACSSYEKAGPEGWLPLAAVLVHTAAMADLAAMLRNAVYQALTTLHERPRPAASFSSLSPHFKRPIADRSSSPPAIRAAAALAVSIGHLAAALLALRKPSSSTAALSQHPLIGKPSTPSFPHQPEATDAENPLDAMYPNPICRNSYEGHAASNGYRAGGQAQISLSRGQDMSSSLALALSRAGRPAMLVPRTPQVRCLTFPDPLYWRLDDDHRKPILQSLRDEEPVLERRVALETKQIFQALAEQRGGGIANPQLACGLLLFGDELPGGKQGVELWMQQGSWQHALRLTAGCAEAAAIVHGVDSHHVLDTRDWAAATLEQVVAAACHQQAPADARSNLFAACTAAEQLDEGAFDIKPFQDARPLNTLVRTSAIEGLVDRACELHKRLPLLSFTDAFPVADIAESLWALLGQMLVKEIRFPSGHAVTSGFGKALQLCEGLTGQSGLAAAVKDGLADAQDGSVEHAKAALHLLQEIGEGLQRSEMVTEEQWAWLVQGAAAWEAGSQSLRAAWHETCIQVDLVMTCQTALVLAEADLPSRQDSWAQDMTAAGPQNGPTLTPETPISPRDHSLLWESNQECVHLLLSTLTRLTWALACQRALGEAMRRLTAAQHQAWMSGKAQATAGESELGWEVLRQAAALAASSHGQSSLTTRQLLHGACAGLRSISQDQMDFMAVNQLQPLQRPLQPEGLNSTGSSYQTPQGPGVPSWWPAWEAHVLAMSEGLSKYTSNGSTSRMMRRTASATTGSQSGLIGCILEGLEGISSRPDVAVLPFLSDCFKHPLCIGLEGRETEGEAQCALLSLCGERVRGGVLTWEAARLKAALQLSSKRGGSSGMLASPIAPSAKPIRLGRQTSDVRAGSSVNTASPTAFGASTRLPATRSLQQQPAASAPVAEPSSPYSALRKPRQPASEQMFAKGAGGNSQVLSPSEARQAWQQLESQSSLKSDASSISPISKQGSGNLGVKGLAAALAARSATSAQSSPRDHSPQPSHPLDQSQIPAVIIGDGLKLESRNPTPSAGYQQLQRPQEQSPRPVAAASSCNGSNSIDDMVDLPDAIHNPSAWLHGQTGAGPSAHASTRDGHLKIASPHAAASLQATAPQASQSLQQTIDQPRTASGSPRRISSGPIPRSSKTGLIRAYTPVDRSSPSALAPLDEEDAVESGAWPIPSRQMSARYSPGEPLQGMPTEKQLESAGQLSSGMLLQQVVLEEEPNTISSEILLAQGPDGTTHLRPPSTTQHIPRTHSTFAPAPSPAPPPRMRASADVYQRPSQRMEGTLRQRYSIAPGMVSPTSPASSPEAGTSAAGLPVAAFPLPTGLAPLKIRLPPASEPSSKPWLKVEPVQHGSFTGQRSPNTSLQDIKLGLTSLQSMDHAKGAGEAGTRSGRPVGQRPVAEAQEAVKGGPAWAIDQLLTVPDSQLYATAAAASSDPNLQVHLDNLPHEASPSVDEVYSPLSNGLHRLQLGDGNDLLEDDGRLTAYSMPASKEDDAFRDAAGTSFCSWESGNEGASEAEIQTQRQWPHPEAAICTCVREDELQLDDFWAGRRCLYPVQKSPSLHPSSWLWKPHQSQEGDSLSQMTDADACSHTSSACEDSAEEPAEQAMVEECNAASRIAASPWESDHILSASSCSGSSGSDKRPCLHEDALKCQSLQPSPGSLRLLMPVQCLDRLPSGKSLD